MGQLDINAVGCTKGLHLIDAALAIVLPPVLEAFIASAEDRSQNMLSVAEAMKTTGESYRQAETNATNLASKVGEL